MAFFSFMLQPIAALFLCGILSLTSATFDLHLREDPNRGSPVVVGNWTEEGTCYLDIRLIYDFANMGSKTMFDFRLFLESCESDDERDCSIVSRAAPKCGNRCWEENEFANSLEFLPFEMGNKNFTVHLILSKKRNFADVDYRVFRFRVRMLDPNTDEKQWSEQFKVNTTACPQPATPPQTPNPPIPVVIVLVVLSVIVLLGGGAFVAYKKNFFGLLGNRNYSSAHSDPKPEV